MYVTDCFHFGYNMDKLDAMNAFVKVVASGSYAEAARKLRLTRSAVSKAGRAYFERCAEILASVEETELQVSRLHEEPRGVLKINAPMSFGTLYLGAAIAEFMTRYPELRLELTLNDRFVDPIEEGVDVTVRIGDLPDSSLVARKLAPARRVLAA